MCALRASGTRLRSVYIHPLTRKSGFFLEDKQELLKYPDKKMKFYEQKA